jgi:hypothetical protein
MGVSERVEMSLLLNNSEHISEIREWFENLWAETGEIDSLELQEYVHEITKVKATFENSNICLNSNAPVVKSKIINESDLQEVSKDTAVPSVMRYTLETRFFEKPGFSVC